MKLRRFAFLIVAIAAAIVLQFPGCASETKDKYAYEEPTQTLTSIGTGTGVTNTGGGNGLAFTPLSTAASPGQTINYTLSGGVPPYEIGFLSINDFPSHAGSIDSLQGSYNANTGIGDYVVGPNGGCTDRLFGRDSTGATAYLTINVSEGGGTTVTGSGNTDEMEVLDLCNVERAKVGVAALSWCDGLWALAKAHSNDMCERDFFDHVNPEGESPSDRARYGHAGRFTFDSVTPDPYSWGVGENIAWGYDSPASVMNGWMNSPGHRANILDSSYSHLGVGQCDFCGRHWTQNFGTR
ncbi:MAG: CAP domain-containing protein [Planctomycetota bacterium]|jgi:uncharacterized protein YkwD